MTKNIQSPRYKKILAAFQKDRETKGRGELPKDQVRQIREFFCFLESKGIFDVKEITYGLVQNVYIKEYLSVRPLHLHPDRVLSRKTLVSHARTISKLNEFLLVTKQVKQNWGLLKGKYDSYNERAVITQEEVPILFSACENSFEKALITLAYGCGLRRSEMVKLNTQDMNFREGILVVREGKFSKRREVVMSDKVIEFLQEYLRFERIQRLEKSLTVQHSFFVNRNGNRVDGNKLNKFFRKIIAQTQNESLINRGLGLHSLRHSIAEHLLTNGAEFEFVQQFLGHSCIDTTMIYARKLKMKNQNRMLIYE